MISKEYLKREGKQLRSKAWREKVLERLVYPTLGARPIADVKRSDVVLKPLKQEPSTLLFVDTKAPNGTMRHYRFQLDTRDPPGPATQADMGNYVAVNMVYPEVIEAERQEAAARRAAARAQAAAARILSGEP